jgi:transposase-like protein
MEVMEAIRCEALDEPQPGVDYCQRIAVLNKSLRLTLLLEDKFSRPPETPPQKARPVGPRDKAPPEMRAMLAMAAASYHGAETEAEEAEARKRYGEIVERLDRPEVAEMVETSPAPAAVARLCREFGLPADTQAWLATADAALEGLGYAPPDEPAAAPPVDQVPDQRTLRRRLRVIMALGAAIQAVTPDEADWDRRFFEMGIEMDRPELQAIADSHTAAEAVALLCPEFGLPPEQAERWVAESDEYLARLDLSPVDGDPPPDTG